METSTSYLCYLLPYLLIYLPMETKPKPPITKEGGKWLVNGKPYSEMYDSEKDSLSKHISQHKN